MDGGKEVKNRNKMGGNMQNKLYQAIFVVVAAFFLIGGSCVSFAQAKERDNDPQATGLRVMTEEEDKAFIKKHPKVKKVKPNALGLKRINKARLKKGYFELNEELAVPMGEELETSVVTDPSQDLFAAEDVSAEVLPAYVDNSSLPAFPPIRSQGSLNSCVSFSVTYYQLTHMVGLQLGWDNKNSDNSIKFSPKWTYNFVNGGENAGTYFSNNYAALQKHGAVRWSEFPYDSNYRQWCLDTAAWRRAIKFRTDPVQYVYGVSSETGLEQVKQLLINGNILIFGTYINSWQWTTIKDDPSLTEDDAFVGKRVAYWLNGTSGAHSMTIVGYNDDLWIDVNGNGTIEAGEKGALRIANSWGTGWGEAGFTWLAYDALKFSSTIPGAPSTGRKAALQSDRVYVMSVNVAYSPMIVAEFTVNHAKRNQLRMNLGISETSETSPASTWYPGAISFQGGPYSFNGTTTPVDGTFVFDFTDIVPSGSTQKRYYLGMYDGANGDSALVRDFKIIDIGTAIEKYSTTVPMTADAQQVYAYVDYVYNDGNQAPFAQAQASPVSGTAPLTVTFDGSGSYDSDGVIFDYFWEFGDGASKSGVTTEHVYAGEGDFQVKLTVTDDRGAKGFDVLSISVASDPDVVAAPTNLLGTLLGNTVTLTWRDNSNNEEGFYIERGTKVKRNFIYEQVAQVGSNNTTYSETVDNGSYYYRLKAYNAFTQRESDYSNAIRVSVGKGGGGKPSKKPKK